MTAAALGTSVPLELLDGTEEIGVKAGTQSGSVVTLKARGIPHLAAPAAANITCMWRCAPPPGSNDEQAELLRRLAEMRAEEHPRSLPWRPRAALLPAARRLRQPPAVRHP